MSFSGSIDRSWIQTILACPCCRAELAEAPGMLHCSRCDAEFKQSSDLWVNLYPEEPTEADVVAWRHRQDEMHGWYRKLVSDRDHAVGCFHRDYWPFATVLQGLSGCVLDLGGGIGVTRHFLTAAKHYVVLDPGLDWFSADWTTLSGEFPCLSSFPCFVHGVGEQLPFHNCSFNAVVALWSLNHVRDPAAVLSEVHRVLMPSGRFIAVLEDMIPRWRDTLLPSRRYSGEALWHAVLPSRRHSLITDVGVRACSSVKRGSPPAASNGDYNPTIYAYASRISQPGLTVGSRLSIASGSPGIFRSNLHGPSERRLNHSSPTVPSRRARVGRPSYLRHWAGI